MSLRALLVLSLVFATACTGSDGNPSPADAGMTGGSEGSGGDASGGSEGSGGEASGGSEGSGGDASGGSEGSGGEASGGSEGSGGEASGGSEGSGGDASGGSEGSGGTDPCAGLDCTLLDDDCNRGVCSVGLGACVAEPRADGTVCDDGDVCTESDECSAGVCSGSAKDCSGLDTTCAVGVCNASSGACEAQATNEAGACDDGNPCTLGDACSAGVCSGSAKDCSGLDATCAVGVCNASSGACEAQATNEAGACDDGDSCTVGDACSQGVCGGAPKDCSGLDTACGIGTCNASTGQCEVQPANDAGPCDDGDPCTVSDVCLGGACAGAAKDCSADDGACVRGVCDPSTGECALAAANEGEICYPECFNGGTCQSGICTCSDGPCLSTTTDSAGCGILFWCGLSAPGEDPCAATAGAGSSLYGDGYCDCGCAMPDPDCNNCGDPTCDTNQCDSGGNARTDCPLSFKSNGQCDCGCQFVDPECAPTQLCLGTNQVCSDGVNSHDCPAGTACAAAGGGLDVCTWTPAPSTSVEADCVCQLDSFCCNSSWDSVCVDLYVNSCAGACQP